MSQFTVISLIKFNKLRYHFLLLNTLKERAEIKYFSIKVPKTSRYADVVIFFKKLIPVIPYDTKRMLNFIADQVLRPLKTIFQNNELELQFGSTTSFSPGYGYKDFSLRHRKDINEDDDNVDSRWRGRLLITLQKHTLTLDLSNVAQDPKELMFDLRKEPFLVKKLQTLICDYYVYKIKFK